MDYHKIHNNIISKAKSENRKKLEKTHSNYIYYEDHHIIPEHFFIDRSRKGRAGWLVGNPEDPANKVLLTGREHYVVHQLLIKVYPEHKYGLIKAVHKMTSINQYQTGRSKNKLYEWVRKLYSEALSNREVPKQTRLNFSLAKTGENNPMFGKTGESCPNYGLKRSNKTLELMRKNSGMRGRKGKDHPSSRKQSKEEIRKRLETKAIKYYKPIICIELNKIFENAAEATIFANLKSPSDIRKAISEPNHTAGGYHWAYV